MNRSLPFGARAQLASRLVLALTMSVAALGCPASNTPAGDAGPPVDAARLADDAYVPPGVDAFVTGADTGVAPSCEPLRVTAEACRPLCDGPDQWYWDGERCVRFDCGECVGEDCGLGVVSEAECTSAHASCEPELCRTTGGDWLFWEEECEHYRCGEPQPAPCLIGRPVCDCGPGRVFEVGAGCVSEGTCPDPLPSPEALCNATGGTWENVCCPSHCGVPCAAECLAPACTCGPLEVFDATRGCVESSECHDGRMVDQTCTTEGTVRCGDGLICCQDCGGAGCFGEPTCRAPTCDPSGMLDVCGNNPLAP